MSLEGVDYRRQNLACSLQVFSQSTGLSPYDFESYRSWARSFRSRMSWWVRFTP